MNIRYFIMGINNLPIRFPAKHPANTSRGIAINEATSYCNNKGVDQVRLCSTDLSIPSLNVTYVCYVRADGTVKESK